MGIGESITILLAFFSLVAVVCYFARYLHKRRNRLTTISFLIVCSLWAMFFSTVAFFPEFAFSNSKPEIVFVGYRIVMIGILVGSILTIFFSLREWLTSK